MTFHRSTTDGDQLGGIDDQPARHARRQRSPSKRWFLRKSRIRSPSHSWQMPFGLHHQYFPSALRALGSVVDPSRARVLLEALQTGRTCKPGRSSLFRDRSSRARRPTSNVDSMMVLRARRHPVRNRLAAGARRIRTLGPSRESVGPCGRRGNAEALKRDGLVKACRAPFPGCAETFHTTQQTALSCCRRRPSTSRSVRSPQRRSALPPKAARSVRGSTAAKAGALRWRPITMAV